MYYVVFDTFNNEDSDLIYDRYDALDIADDWNYQEGEYRFIPLALNDSYYRNPYQNNPDHLPIPVNETTIVDPDWKTKVREILEDFNPRIDWSVVKMRRRTRSVEFSTPRSRSKSYVYRITLAKDSEYSAKLVSKSPKSPAYYAYRITDAYLDDSNLEIMHAVFRLLFMGDEYLLPFLSQNSKVLTTPQKKAFDGFFESYRRGDRKGAIILPTGIGKTVVAAKIIVELKPRPKRLLFVSHRNFILNQAIKAIKHEAEEKGWMIQNDDIGKFYGTYGSSGEKREELQKKYVFANPQSFNTIPKEKWLDSGEFELIIVDEFHHGNAETWLRVIKHFHPRFLLGLTATPHRSDAEEPLSLINSNILYKAAEWEKKKNIRTLTLIDALKLGYLVTPILRTLIEPVYKTIEGKVLSPKALKKAETDRARAIIERYKRDAHDKQAVVFCSGVDEAINLEEAFKEAGIRSSHILGTPEHKMCCQDVRRHMRRTKILADFKSKKTQVLFVVDVLNEGVDIKNIEVILWLRETVGVVRLLQQLGRGLRLDKGKRNLLVLDFMNNVSRIQDYLAKGFTPTGWGPATSKTKKKPADRKEEEEIIQLLDSQGLIETGEDISLFSMNVPIEHSDDEITPHTTLLAAMKRFPKLTAANKKSIAKARITLDLIRARIIESFSLPKEKRPYVAQIAKKHKTDPYNIGEILHEAGLLNYTLIPHPSNIEITYSEEGQNQIVKQLDKPERAKLRKIIRAGRRDLGHRSFGKKEECRIPSCTKHGKHRGMCETHYLFAYKEIREGRASEDDLITRFLLEPQSPAQPSRKLRRWNRY
jgi:superfamily II DNA or RNA helicase